MNAAIENVARKRERLAKVLADKEKARKKWLERWEKAEAEAQEDLENVIGLVLSGKFTTTASVMQATGYSNTKVRAMAERARRRNMKLMRSGYDG